MIRNEKGKTSLGKGKGEKEMGKVDMRIYSYICHPGWFGTDWDRLG